MKNLVAVILSLMAISSWAAPERRPVNLIVTGQVVSFSDKEAVLMYKDSRYLLVDRKLISKEKLVKDKEVKVELSFAQLKEGLERGKLYGVNKNK